MTMGYFETANVNVPLNKRDKGELADVAKEQLAYYEAFADEWGVFLDTKSDAPSAVRHPMRCNKCQQSIYFLRDEQGRGYDYSKAEIRSLTVAHIRQCHSELSPGRGRNPL